MERLFYSLIYAYCWLRVAASPLLLGAMLGTGGFFLIRGPAGVVIGGAAVFVGLILGIRLAHHAQQKGQLVEYAHGLSPGKRGPVRESAAKRSRRSREESLEDRTIVGDEFERHDNTLEFDPFD